MFKKILMAVLLVALLVAAAFGLHQTQELPRLSTVSLVLVVLAVAVIGIALSLVNLFVSAVGSAIASIVGNFVFVDGDEDELYFANATFAVFLLVVPGSLAHMVEAAAFSKFLPAQLASAVVATTAGIYACMIFAIWFKATGLLRRTWPAAARVWDNAGDRISGY